MLNKNLFGEDVIEDILLKDRFIEPPFSVLDTRQGRWQERKKQWINLGAGLQYYNELILLNVAGSLPIRAGKQFDSGRKIGRTHQNILVFFKGDSKNIKNRLNLETPLEMKF